MSLGLLEKECSSPALSPACPGVPATAGRLLFNSLPWASVSSGGLAFSTPASGSQPQGASQGPMIGASPSQGTLPWPLKSWPCPPFWPPCPMSSHQPEHRVHSVVCVPFRTELPEGRTGPTHLRDLGSKARVDREQINKCQFYA